jgi:hypothetical protein
MNLKKLAMWKRRQQTMPPAPQPVAAAATFFVSNLLFAIKKQLPKFFLEAVFVYSLRGRNIFLPLFMGHLGHRCLASATKLF